MLKWNHCQLSMDFASYPELVWTLLLTCRLYPFFTKLGWQNLNYVNAGKYSSTSNIAKWEVPSSNQHLRYVQLKPSVYPCLWCVVPSGAYVNIQKLHGQDWYQINLRCPPCPKSVAKCHPVLINQLEHLVDVLSFFDVGVRAVRWLAEPVEPEYPLTNLNNVTIK